MPKSKEFVDTSGSESGSDAEPKQKKKKAEKSKKSKESKPSKSKAASSGDETMIELGKMRYATVSEFRGRKMVNIREYYEADGELRPGRKGIALSEDQWKKLKSSVDKIDEALEEL